MKSKNWINEKKNGIIFTGDLKTKIVPLRHFIKLLCRIKKLGIGKLVFKQEQIVKKCHLNSIELLNEIDSKLFKIYLNENNVIVVFTNKGNDIFDKKIKKLDFVDFFGNITFNRRDTLIFHNLIKKMGEKDFIIHYKKLQKILGHSSGYKNKSNFLRYVLKKIKEEFVKIGGGFEVKYIPVPGSRRIENLMITKIKCPDLNKDYKKNKKRMITKIIV
jgi:hypothetical protein